MENAPFYSDLADGPETGAAYWLTTSDGVRVRMGVWPEGTKGTVLLFPGRTEYVEKYGRAAEEIRTRGYATIAMDWRGQGIADRLLDDPLPGHVVKFTDYQHDVDAMLAAVRDLGLPEPYHVIGHSMGGAIALRALYNNLPVKSAVFSAPMWGIKIAPHMRPIAHVVSTLATMIGQGRHYTPGTTRVGYVNENPFADNMLTTDPEMWDFMVEHMNKRPELGIAGPSLQWLYEALAETRDLMAKPAPNVPTLTFLGTQERIVDIPPIKKRMGNWPDGRLMMIPKCEHEMMMEGVEIRTNFFDQSVGLFDQNT